MPNGGPAHGSRVLWWAPNGVPVNGIGVVLLGLAVILTAGISVPGHWGLFELQPHPLWLLVMGVAIRYGNPSGLVAGALAATGYAALLRSAPAAPSDWLAPAELAQPALLLVAGAVAGQVISNQQRRCAEAERRFRQVVGLWRTFYQRHTRTVSAMADLHSRLAALRATAGTLCPAAGRPAPREEDVYTHLIELLPPLVGIRRLAVYRLVDGALELRAGLPSEAPGRPAVLGATDGEALGAGARGMAARLCGADGRQLGLLVIEDQPADGLSAPAVACVERVARCASLALEDVLTRERRKSPTSV